MHLLCAIPPPGNFPLFPLHQIIFAKFTSDTMRSLMRDHCSVGRDDQGRNSLDENSLFLCRSQMGQNCAAFICSTRHIRAPSTLTPVRWRPISYISHTAIGLLLPLISCCALPLFFFRMSAVFFNVFCFLH